MTKLYQLDLFNQNLDNVNPKSIVKKKT